jgi:hypothetical protein
MLCETIKEGVDCFFMKKDGCQFPGVHAVRLLMYVSVVIEFRNFLQANTVTVSLILL